MVIKLSCGRSVSLCVGLSSALWRNIGSEQDAVWHHRSDRSRDEAGFGNRSTGRGTFGVEFGAHHCNKWGLCGIGVRQCLNHLSCGLGWCVRWAEALLYWIGGPRHASGGQVLGFLFPVFTMGNGIRSPTVKCF